MIERFVDIQQDFPGQSFIGPDKSIWKFANCQESIYASFQWSIYESETHTGVLVWIGYCGYNYDDTYNDEVWEVYSSRFIYLPSLEVWKEGLANGDFR